MNVKDYGSSLRSQAIGMLKTGERSKTSAQRLNVNIRSFKDGGAAIILDFRCQPCMKVKFPAKIQVRGMMSHQALSKLHIIPLGETVNGEYYRTKILAGACTDAINGRAESGSVLERFMTSEMSGIIFMQDGAPAHTAKLTQE